MKKNVNNSTVNGASAASSAQSTNSYMQYTQYCWSEIIRFQYIVYSIDNEVYINI